MENNDILQDLKKFQEVAIVLLEGFNFVLKSSEVSAELVSEIKSALITLKSLEGDVRPLKIGLVECKSKLVKVNVTAETVVNRAEACLKYANVADDHKRKIYDSVNIGDCTSLNNYLRQVRHYFKQCKECYEKSFKCHCDQAIEACEEGEEDYKRRIDEAKFTKKAGKITAAVGVTGGVAGLATAAVMGASVVTGVLTMGIGAPIVIGLGSLLGGAVTTAVGGAITLTGSHHEHETSTHFSGIKKKFTEMKKYTTDQGDIIFEVFEKIKVLNYDRKILHNSANEDKDEDSFQKAFELMLEHIQKALEKVEECRKQLEQNSKEIKEIHIPIQ